MLKLILALVISVIAMLLIGPKVLPVLRKLKFGQTEYELGPKSHQVKQGTPTMGGLMFAAVTCVVTLLLVYVFAPGESLGGWNVGLALVLVALLNLLIGLVDDYIKVVKKRNLGLVWWQKVVGQVVVSVAFSLYCYLNPYVGSSVIVPFANVEWDLGVFYVPLMTCVMIFMVNSANLQDGLDGLLSSVTVIGSATWGLMALFVVMAATAMAPALSQNYQYLAIFAMALAGGCMGFLRFNHYPALVFMGDTGSMFIGGAMVGMAMLLRMPIFMLLVMFPPFASSMSVIIQRVYFKVTHGKRIFKMSPIHHHFELSGMSEMQIVGMYALVEGLLCLVALLSLKLM